jgi:queuine tRNA-ribosyltransferase
VSTASLDPEVVVTRTGVKAMRDRITGELMHPVVGPQIEAERLYVGPSRLAARLASPREEPLVVLDVGLGAGSNAIAAWRVSESLGAGARRLRIVSFDQSVDAMAMALAPEHAASFGFDEASASAAGAVLSRGTHETARTTWELVRGDLHRTLALAERACADVVFWDPFSPGANPSLWTAGAFALLFPLCRVGATVHTYGGATASRAALLLAGFAVGEGEVTGDASKAGQRKRGTVAALRSGDLERPLDRRWLERLQRSSAPLPADAPTDAMARIAASPQFSV